jgi:putative transposase
MPMRAESSSAKPPRRYLYKLYPTYDQIRRLHQWRVMCGELWDGLLEFSEQEQRRVGKLPSAYDLGHHITALRRECPEWAELPQMTEAAIAKHVELAYRAFFRRMKELSNPAVYEAQAAAFVARRGRRPTRYELAGFPRRKNFSKFMNSIPLSHMESHPPTAGKTRGTSGKNGWGLTQNPLQPLSWRLYVKGLTPFKGTAYGDKLHLRGELPCEPERYRNANILWRDGHWWLSLCVELDCSREHGAEPMTVRFDLLDEFASANGLPEILPGLMQTKLLGERIDQLKSERDKQFPRGRRRNDEDKMAMRVASRQIAKLYAKATRITRNALHCWTTDIISRASDLTIIAPDLQREVRTPHGNEQSWGSNTAVVSDLNRHVLGQCPGMAIQMLHYKAEEAGIRCDVVRDKAPSIGVAADLVTVGKRLRRAKRKLKQEEAHETV